MSYAGLKPSFTSATTTAAMTAGTGITAPTGDVVATLGAVSAATTVTGGTGVTATTGNIVATAGQVNAGTTMTAGTGITATTGNIVSTAGQVNAGTTMTAGTGITSTTGNITATAGALSAGTTVIAGTGITATTGAITATAGNVVITAGNMTLPDTTASQGIIRLNSVPFMHAFPGTTSQNCFLGDSAGNLTMSGLLNSGIGSQTLVAVTTGQQNTACGGLALNAATIGSNNTAIGVASLAAIGSGSDNIAVGYSSGQSYTGSESSNILIGNFGVVAESNKIRIGRTGSGTAQQNACFIAGIFGVTVGGSGVPVNVDNAGQLGTVVSSVRFKDNIVDMPSTNVMNLRPVTFTYKTSEDKSVHYGLIAEEVEKVMPDMVVYDDKKQPMSVKYHELPAILLAEIQKLNKRIEQLEQKV